MATRILVVDDSPTIRTVVSSILERSGYEVSTAVDGQDAYEVLASGRAKADIVLVDFVMPRMNGFQFCRALRENGELASTPIVLMSAKGDRIRDQFVQQTGALDAITKPFDAQALVAVVENALRRMNTNRGSAARLPEGEDDPDITRIGTVQIPALLDHETRRTHVAQIVAQKLASIVARTVSDEPELSSSPNLENALSERLSNEAILEMMEVIHEVGRPEEAVVLLSGDLAAVPVGAILQLLQAENLTGVLLCTNGEAEVRATFRHGAIDLVQSTGVGDEFRLGRFFIDEGVLTVEQIDEVNRNRARAEDERRASDDVGPRSSIQMRESSTNERTEEDAVGTATLRGSDVPAFAAVAGDVSPLGMALVSAGKISEAQLRTALTRQSSELLYEVLRWPAGRFELRREAPSVLADNAKLAMPVASVVMEGFRRVDEWRVLEGTLGSFDAVLLRDDAAFGTLDVASLPSRERAVLDAVDGERTVRAIVAASHLSSFDACRILVQFLEARVLRRRAA
jgi:DNA-binding response OmpR family regulator